jgi:hypothetical protein
VSEKNIYNPNDFQPSKEIKNRYAEKFVNDRFYGYVRVGDVKEWSAVTGVQRGIADSDRRTIRDTINSQDDYSFAVRNYDFYKERNPWMASSYLEVMIHYLERKIRRDHCREI